MRQLLTICTLLATVTLVVSAVPNSPITRQNRNESTSNPELQTPKINAAAPAPTTTASNVDATAAAVKDTPLHAVTMNDTVSNAKRYDGDQVFKVFTVNSKHRKRIKEIESSGKGQKWKSNTTSVDLFVKREKINEVKEILNNSSMDFRIMVEDVQKAIDEENPPVTSDELNEFASRKGHRVTFENYHRMADFHGFLEYMANSRSDFVSVYTIGQSIEGRPLKVIKISSGKPNSSAFWIDGGTHAREWITVATVAWIINELVENRASLDKELLDTDFYILPIMNPDGYEYSHEYERLWRKNRRRGYGEYCRGTDLNRNWGYEWGGQGSGKYQCQDIYAGVAPFSEPETKAASDFILKLQQTTKVKGFVTFHSYGQYILYPWGYAKRLPADVDEIDRVGRLAAAAIKQSSGAVYTVGNSASLLYAASGGADDWAKGGAKIKYAYTIELRDTGRHGFLLPASQIKPVGKEAFAAVRAIVKETYA